MGMDFFNLVMPVDLAYRPTSAQFVALVRAIENGGWAPRPRADAPSFRFPKHTANARERVLREELDEATLGTARPLQIAFWTGQFIERGLRLPFSGSVLDEESIGDEYFEYSLALKLSDDWIAPPDGDFMQTWSGACECGEPLTSDDRSLGVARLVRSTCTCGRPVDPAHVRPLEEDDDPPSPRLLHRVALEIYTGKFGLDEPAISPDLLAAVAAALGTPVKEAANGY